MPYSFMKEYIPAKTPDDGSCFRLLAYINWDTKPHQTRHPWA